MTPGAPSANSPTSSGRRAPSSISTVALITKTSRRAAESEPTYSGLHITDEFIHGYGLDWDEAYRDLPFIALADP